MALGPDALPIGQLIMLDLLFPSIEAAMWWMMSRTLATVLQGGNVTERFKKLLNRSFWIVLAAAYLLMFGITAFVYLK